MGESRGGHSAKEDDESKYQKFMIDFEGRSMDYRTIGDISIDHKSNPDNESGVEFRIVVVRSLYPGETIFSFESEAERDLKLTKLRNKLQMLRTVFIT